MPEYDPQEQYIVKRLDERLIPILAITFFVALMNQSTLELARAHVMPTLQMTDQNFILCLAGVFIGSFPFALPSTMLMRLVRPSRWFTIMLSLGGMLVCGMAASRGYIALFVLRIFFGAAQVGILPCTLVYLSMFYTRDERTVRLSLVVSLGVCASAFCALFTRSVEGLDGLGEYSGWRWLFIFEGMIAVGVSAVIWFLLPDFPETTLMLSPADRIVASSRVRDEDDPDPMSPSTASYAMQRLGGTAIKAHSKTPQPPPVRMHLHQLHATLTDCTFYLLAISYTCTAVAMDAVMSLSTEIAAGTFTRGSGVTRYTLNAALVSVVPYCLAAFAAVFVARRSDSTGDRGLHVALGLLLAGAGLLTMAVLPETQWTPLDALNTTSVLNGVSIDDADNLLAEQADERQGRDGGVIVGALRYLLGLFPASIGLVCALPCLLASVMDRAHGSTAREAAAALMTAFGSVGSSIIVPQLFPPSLQPIEGAEGVASWGRGYNVGCGALAIACGIGAAAALVVRWIKRQEDEGMWGRGRGLRRLLNDAEEKGVWDQDASGSLGDVNFAQSGPNIAMSGNDIDEDGWN